MSVLICNVIPQEYVSRYVVSQASNSFCEQLIKVGFFSYSISLVPITVIDNLNLQDNKSVKYIQKRRFKQCGIGRYLNALFETRKAAICCMKEDNIWFYNLTNQNILLYLFLKYLLMKRVFIILADFTPPLKHYSLASFIQLLLKFADGIISLSSRSTIRNHNMKVLPGIIDINTLKVKNEYKLINKKTFLFSGFLGKVTGIDIALDFFSKHSNLNLIVTGRGEHVLVVKQYAEKYNNICYKGFLDFNSYKKILEDVDICLNLRNPYLPENMNNFPSKILEFFANSKIVISSIRYPELNYFNYFYTDYNVHSMSLLINNIIEMDDEKLRLYMDNLQNICVNVSFSAWSSTLKEIENNTVK